MCTAITLYNDDHAFLGRTMDFSYPLSPELYMVPRGFRWTNLLNTHQFQNSYSFLGIGQDISPVTFADGVNEKGFSAAALYFPGGTQYDPIPPTKQAASKKPPIAATELLRFLLGFSTSVNHAASLLETISIVGITDSITESIAPLHWILADQSGACLAVEKMADGLHLTPNPLGVLSNSPDLPWHITNLRNYMNVLPTQHLQANWGNTVLTPFGQGAGTIGLPGDFTPPSRFIRAAYVKTHTFIPSGKEGAVVSLFHILDSVTIAKGNVITDRKTSDYTQYTAFMDLNSKEYFFKTYDNSRITRVGLSENTPHGLDIQSLGKINKPIRFDQMDLL